MKRLIVLFPLLLCLAWKGSPTASEGYPAAALVAKGDAAYKKFDNNAALDAYKRALERDPGNYEAAWKLARAYVDVGEKLPDKGVRRSYYEKAHAYAQKAVEINPDGSKAHLFLSIAIGRVALDASPKERVRLSKEVKMEVDKALALDPRDDSAWHVLGRWHRRLSALSWLERKFANMFLGGVPKEASVQNAIDCFKRAIELNPSHIHHHLELAITYEKAGKKELAVAEYKRVLDLPVTDADDEEHKEVAKKRLEEMG